MKPTLKIYKISNDVHDVVFATEGAACFDIKAYLDYNIGVKSYDYHNEPHSLFPSIENTLAILPGNRVLVPTGLIFDIPQNYSIRLHPRSGTALKYGIVLANCEGVIDSDYVEQTFILVTNDSGETYYIKNGERICQAELVKKLDYNIEYTTVKPTQKTSRDGGFNSTGK